MNTPVDCDIPLRPGAVPVLDTTKVNAICYSEYTGYMRVQNAVLGWLRWHFSDTSRIAYDQLKNYVYTADDKTPLLIESLAAYKPELAAARPAILVNVDAQEPKTHSLGNNRLLGGCGTGNLRDFRSVLWAGRHVVHCVGGREGESQLLAAEVFKELNEFAPVMRYKLGLVRFILTAIGARRKMEEHKETWTIPIGLMYGYWETWRVIDLQAGEISGIQTPTVLGTN